MVRTVEEPIVTRLHLCPVLTRLFVLVLLGPRVERRFVFEKDVPSGPITKGRQASKVRMPRASSSIVKTVKQCMSIRV